jgi:putative FmdB family regulatory protein
MPIYEYSCPDHGLFEDQRPMSRSADPSACPKCRADAPRVLSVTRTSLVPRAHAIARSRNEKSQHAPEVRHVAPGAHAAPSGAAAGPRRPLQVSHGSRPWVLEHGGG